MISFMDLIRNMEKEAKERSANAVKEDSPKCVNCGFVGRDGLRTEICTMCGSNSRKKLTRTVTNVEKK